MVGASKQPKLPHPNVNTMLTVYLETGQNSCPRKNLYAVGSLQSTNLLSILLYAYIKKMNAFTALVDRKTKNSNECIHCIGLLGVPPLSISGGDRSSCCCGDLNILLRFSNKKSQRKVDAFPDFKILSRQFESNRKIIFFATLGVHKAGHKVTYILVFEDTLRK